MQLLIILLTTVIRFESVSSLHQSERPQCSKRVIVLVTSNFTSTQLKWGENKAIFGHAGFSKYSSSAHTPLFVVLSESTLQQNEGDNQEIPRTGTQETGHLIQERGEGTPQNDDAKGSHTDACHPGQRATGPQGSRSGDTGRNYDFSYWT